jgi:FAD/FMN-containing dehydrogenase
MQTIEGFAGRQLAAGDIGYDEARALFNGMIDGRPTLIAQCASPDDVARAVAHALHHEMPLAVRAGGHSVAGTSTNDGGVVVDVRPLTEISVDAGARTVRCGTGITWSDLDRVTQEHGLATTGGRVSTTGVAGLTLGGGSGWLERLHGLACDNLTAVDLVTATGEQVHASADENPELLWALRGGGGNFGVATALEFRLHPLGPTVYGGLAIYDPADAPTLLRAMRDFYLDAPDEAALAFMYMTAPPEPFIPDEWQGRLVATIAGMWIGPMDEGASALRPLVDTARPVVDLVDEIPYTELQSMIDDPSGLRNWWTADYLDELPDAAVDEFCSYGERMPLSSTCLLVIPWGGAVARASDASCMPNRDAAWVVHPYGLWEERARDDEHIAWGRASHGLFAPWSTGGTYLNFIGDEGADRVRAGFGTAYERLSRVKAEWDPDNVFRGNQNIRPAHAVH